MELLQIYWWFVISLLGALLVALLFVQGGQTMIVGEKNADNKMMMVNALGRKWELTFTTLVTFGGAFFAAFPLYYATSFGGAYWLWMLILLSFILQAVSYEFRSKPGNVFGTKTYDVFLWINGFIGCVLLGEAVAMQFFGGSFTVTRQSILDGAAPVISQWSGTHGLELLLSPCHLLLGVAVFFLARTLASLFFGMSITADGDKTFVARMRTRTLLNGVVFVVLFLAFLAVLLLHDGYTVAADGKVEAVANKYLFNLIEMWWLGLAFVIGVLLVLFGVLRTSLAKTSSFKCGFWSAALGVVIVVLCLFGICGYNNTCYLPSVADVQSSLTIYNSSSTEFTLRTMACVTVLLPFVVAYIAYVWHKMTSPAITADELHKEEHIY